jgi:hypothetical protein
MEQGLSTGKPISRYWRNLDASELAEVRQTVVLYRKRPGGQMPMAVGEADRRGAFDRAV